MKIKPKTKNTRIISKSQQKLPNQYIDYRYEPKDFIRKLSNHTETKNINPLYSVESFTKYFNKTNYIRVHQSRQQQTSNKRINTKTNKHIENFRKLLAEMRTVKKRFPTKKIDKKIDLLEEFVAKSKMHFDNLNLEDGINPRNSFSRQNLKINQYLKELAQPLKIIRGKTLSNSEYAKKMAHIDNITHYLKEQAINSRYFTAPQLQNQIEQKMDIETCERTNRVLRCKTSYCQLKYQAPFLQKQRLDTEIMTQSRKYMSKMSKIRVTDHMTI